MKKLVAEVFQLQSGTCLPQLYCIDDTGEVDRSVGETLLSLIELSYPREDELEQWIRDYERGDYVSPDFDLPDWGVNDVCVWLNPNMSKPGFICVSNENTTFAVEYFKNPQQFTFQQFWLAMNHWRKFLEIIDREGKEALVGKRFEAPFEVEA